MKSIVKILILSHMAISMASAQIPKKWAQHTEEIIIHVPLETYWESFFNLKLEEVANVGDYGDLPKIVNTTPVKGDFSKVGDSRLVCFSTDQTVLESIIEYQEPVNFVYELTEIEIDLRKVAKRARGQFQYYKLPEGKTKVVWTYGFDQKNFIFKWLINRYIKSTHKVWMQDTLAEMKKQTEKMHVISKQ